MKSLQNITSISGTNKMLFHAKFEPYGNISLLPTVLNIIYSPQLEVAWLPLKPCIPTTFSSVGVAWLTLKPRIPTTFSSVGSSVANA